MKNLVSATKLMIVALFAIAAVTMIGCGPSGDKLEEIQISSDPDPAEIEVGGTVTLTATAIYKNKEVEITSDATWEITEGEDVVELSTEEGVIVTGKIDGDATITATYKDQSDTVTIKVGKGGRVLEKLELDPSEELYVPVGDTNSVAAWAFYSNGDEEDVTESATWTIGEETIATVELGEVTGVAAGETELTATFEDQTDTVKVVVRSAGEFYCKEVKIATAENKTQIPKGSSLQLTATCINSDDTETDVTTNERLTWTTDPEGVVEVEKESGLANGVEVGTTSRMYSTDGHTDRTDIVGSGRDTAI